MARKKKRVRLWSPPEFKSFLYSEKARIMEVEGKSITLEEVMKRMSKRKRKNGFWE
jgi:hypothetical protein|tara:strand:+ start:433 stop:600 length:168 start_codon:yes stop_codon:yes gene_type:complete